MALYVVKFGGTSVADGDRIRHVAGLVIDMRNQGNRVVVVTSAMAGETNRLTELAHSIAGILDARELDALISTGEDVAAALIALELRRRGLAAQSLRGWQIPIETDDNQGNAHITAIGTKRLQALIERDLVPVVTGFQGINAAGDITTLGRGGSDISAVALAAELQADECRIYTDVAGIYTIDPRLEDRARLLPDIHYEEMLEMAALGAKVLHPRSVKFAVRKRVRLRVLSSFTPSEGTLVTYASGEKTMEQASVTSVVHNRDEARLTLCDIPDRPGIAAQILEPIAKAAIEVDMIVQNVSREGNTDFTFTVHRRDYGRSMELLRGLSSELGGSEVLGEDHVAKISVVGQGMRHHSGVAAAMFAALGEAGVNILMITTSEIKISILVEERYMELAARVLHETFKLGEEPRDSE